MKRTTRRFAWRLLPLVIGAALFSAGCQWKGGPAPSHGATGSGNGAQPWVVRPVKMRVYPSTRFVRDGDVLLEARIELLDEMGDSTKGVGHFSFELRSPPRAKLPSVGDRLYAWDMSMLTLDNQTKAYDPITRTYFFRLKVDDPAIAKHDTLLHVVFTDVDGNRIETQAKIAGRDLPTH